jgi:hypothetical protein
MIITKKTVAEKLQKYLQHKITLEELVDWAEQCIMDGEFENKDNRLLKKIVSRLGVADVRTFGLLWEDCEDFLHRLGYKVKIDFSKVA